MKRFRALVLGAVLLVLAACGSATGSISGGLLYVGGPPPGHSDVLQPGMLEIRHGGRTVTSRRLRQGETFQVNLKVGTYTLIGHSGDAMCIPLNIAVPAKRLDVRVLCSVI
jgi:hypothetical protein